LNFFFIKPIPETIALSAKDIFYINLDFYMKKGSNVYKKITRIADENLN